MLKPERKFNNQASKIMFEESFMRTDSRDSYNDAQTGINFEYPIHFASNKSAKKMIGIRNLLIIPTIHTIRLLVLIYDALGDAIGDEIPIEWTITESNNLEEILHAFASINTGILDHSLGYSYNSVTGRVELYGYNINDPKTHLRLTFDDPEHDGTKTDPTEMYPNFTSFLKFLNQETGAVNNVYLSAIDSKIFNGVWNRETLFIHASFASSHRRLIGRNNDFWQTPSKKYEFSTSTNDFNIYFTTNGSNRIFPLHCDLYFELAFILNYDQSID